MEATCSACGNEHENPEWKAGESFLCLCGARVTVPPRRNLARKLEDLSGGRILGLVLLLGVGPLLCLIAGAAFYFVPKARTVAKSSEARVNVVRLCQLALQHRTATGTWPAAGPNPSFIPPGFKVGFEESPDFASLGFAPGKVLYQYQVVVQASDDTALCLARGDLDNDGEISTFSVSAHPKHGVGRWVVSSEDE